MDHPPGRGPGKEDRQTRDGGLDARVAGRSLHLPGVGAAEKTGRVFFVRTAKVRHVPGLESAQATPPTFFQSAQLERIVRLLGTCVQDATAAAK